MTSKYVINIFYKKYPSTKDWKLKTNKKVTTGWFEAVLNGTLQIKWDGRSIQPPYNIEKRNSKFQLTSLKNKFGNVICYA